MKDEIKEINIPENVLSALGDLTNGALNYYKNPKVIELKYKLLLDYITNLQKENEKLKKQETKWEKWSTEKSILSTKMSEYLCKWQNIKREYSNQIKCSTQRKKQLENYKSRNEKAIEYNQQIIKDTKDFYRPTSDTIYSGDTIIDIAEQNINILQGEDKDVNITN